MRLLFVGDIVGDEGLDLTLDLLPRLRRDLAIDSIIVNGENTSNGKGLSTRSAKKLHDAKVDAVTTGNHIWDARKDSAIQNNIPYVLRPHNYPPENPGSGVFEFYAAGGEKVRVINLQGKSFMNPIDCPFQAIDKILAKRSEARITFIDFHAESTAEKQAFGWYLDGKVSAIAGTHTHVQTADDRVLPEGTGYITDVGMTGTYNGVIGMKKELAIRRFKRQTPVFYDMAKGNARLCAVVFDIQSDTGKCTEVKRINTSKVEYNGK